MAPEGSPADSTILQRQAEGGDAQAQFDLAMRCCSVDEEACVMWYIYEKQINQNDSI